MPKSFRYSIVAVVLGSAGLLGCATKPRTVTTVNPSVLPAEAKSMLSSEAEITRVEKKSYSKGAVVYAIHYTLDGREHVIDYNTKDDSTPTGVFQDMH